MKLFEPGRIGKLSLNNRIIMAAMNIQGGSLIEPDGRLSRQGIEYYITRAKGGVGMIITSTAQVNRPKELSLATVFPYAMMADHRIHIAPLSQLADAAHDHGVKIAISLAASTERGGAPSALPSAYNPAFITRPLTLEEIEGIVRAFGNAAQIVKSAGLDAIELNGHLGGLLDQFMTSLWNNRNDKYGGSIDGRLTFAREILGTIKSVAGVDFPVIYKYGLKHYVKGGREEEEGLEIARRLESIGFDALTVDAGTWETTYIVHAPTTQPPGLNVDKAEKVKKVVKIPVIAVGKLGDPKLAESVLQNEKADFIMMGRPLLADPQWLIKVKNGKFDEIRPCLGCLEGCMGRGGKYLSCAVNPATGMERELVLEPKKTQKKVLVIGGGPGGLEAARVASLRGYKVTLWEKEGSLGGNLIPASVPAFKQEYRRLLDYFANQMKILGVAVELRKEATPELVHQFAPDVVFIATGSTPIVPDIPGINMVKAATATDVLLGKKKVGESVLVIGGGLVGSETALYLAQSGKRVTIVEILNSIARDMFTINRMHLLRLLNESNVRILTETSVAEIKDDSVIIVDKEGKRSELNSDTVVLALGMKPNIDLVQVLQNRPEETYIIGDCVRPRKVMDAIWDGYRTARLIS